MDQLVKNQSFVNESRLANSGWKNGFDNFGLESWEKHENYIYSEMSEPTPRSTQPSVAKGFISHS